jgi:hypothetical protein
MADHRHVAVRAEPGTSHRHVDMLPDLTNRSSQPLAGEMRTFDFMNQFREFATLAAASGGSAPSR